MMQCMSTEPTPVVLLTAREVGDFLHVSSYTVRRWVEAGQLEAIRLPSGRLRFRQSDIETLVDRTPAS